jgi:hypothetical protein
MKMSSVGKIAGAHGLEAAESSVFRAGQPFGFSKKERPL